MLARRAVWDDKSVSHIATGWRSRRGFPNAGLFDAPQASSGHLSKHKPFAFGRGDKE